MIYNENGIIINNGYQLDILINEGFTDIANKGLKTVHGWIRKLIDAISNTIEYASRIKYDKIIKNINSMDNYKFKDQINSIWVFIYPYIESEGYGKWIENFNNALNELKRDNTLSVEEINKILYEGKNKNEWFKNGLKNYNASGKKPDISKLKKMAANLQDFTKPLRKSYSELKILNTNINKGMKINSDVMAIMHSYCINAISAYRNMSKILVESCNNVKIEYDDSEKMEEDPLLDGFIKEKDIEKLRASVTSIIFIDRNFSTSKFEDTLNYVNAKINIMENLKGDLISDIRKPPYTKDDFVHAMYKLENNFCKERIEDVKKIGRDLYPLKNDKNQDFKDSVNTAKKAGVDNNKILKNKKDVDDYFTSKKSNDKIGFTSFSEDKFNEAIEKKDYSYIKTCVINAIHNNRGFSNNIQNNTKCEAEVAFEKAISECPEMLEKYKLMEDEIEFNKNKTSKWDIEYMVRQTTLFRRNFCKQRFENIKMVGKHISK